jgi:hypothetical protein
MPLTNPRPFEPVRVDAAKMQRIRQLYEEELKNPKVAKTRDDIPQSFDHISKEWLTDVLGRDTPGSEVVSYKLGMSGVSSGIAFARVSDKP